MPCGQQRRRQRRHRHDYVYGASMVLQNDWDELVIADASGTLVDRVAWDNGATFPDPDGASMSLLDPSSDNARGQRLVHGHEQLGRRRPRDPACPVVVRTTRASTRSSSPR
jgi:hypothetical protein